MGVYLIISGEVKKTEKRMEFVFHKLCFKNALKVDSLPHIFSYSFVALDTFSVHLINTFV